MNGCACGLKSTSMLKHRIETLSEMSDSHGQSVRSLQWAQPIPAAPSGWHVVTEILPQTPPLPLSLPWAVHLLSDNWRVAILLQLLTGSTLLTLGEPPQVLIRWATTCLGERWRALFVSLSLQLGWNYPVKRLQERILFHGGQRFMPSITLCSTLLPSL